MITETSKYKQQSHARHITHHTHDKGNIMAIYKAKESLVRDWPALKVYSRKARVSDTHGEYISIDAEDTLWSGHTGGRAGKTYYAASVMSCALRDGDCPIESYERAVRLGHQIHWIGQHATVVSREPKATREAVEVCPGQVVRFEGRFFKLAPTWNDNLDLIECESE